jgi:hypothetical protein
MVAREIVRRTRQLPETRAVRPDERDIGMGRERLPPTGPWGEEGGMAEGVAHAPLVAESDIDRGTNDNPGGTERRPVRAREVQLQELFRTRLAFCRATRACVSRCANCIQNWGNGAPAFVFPPPFLRFCGFGGRPSATRRLVSGAILAVRDPAMRSVANNYIAGPRGSRKGAGPQAQSGVSSHRIRCLRPIGDPGRCHCVSRQGTLRVPKILTRSFPEILTTCR